VLVRAYADRIVVHLGDEVVADHPRSFKRDQVSTAERKPARAAE
jgi:hypothetical protein